MVGRSAGVGGGRRLRVDRWSYVVIRCAKRGQRVPAARTCFSLGAGFWPAAGGRRSAAGGGASRVDGPATQSQTLGAQANPCLGAGASRGCRFGRHMTVDTACPRLDDYLRSMRPTRANAPPRRFLVLTFDDAFLGWHVRVFTGLPERRITTCWAWLGDVPGLGALNPGGTQGKGRAFDGDPGRHRLSSFWSGFARHGCVRLSRSCLLGCVILAANVLQIHLGLGTRHVQTFQVFHHDPRHGEVPEPLVVGRDDEPGRMFRATPGQGILISRHIIVPEARSL